MLQEKICTKIYIVKKGFISEKIGDKKNYKKNKSNLESKHIYQDYMNELK